MPSGEVWGGHPSLNSAELGPHPSLSRSLTSPGPWAREARLFLLHTAWGKCDVPGPPSPEQQAPRQT